MKNGFTLAEILVTLGVIGIVAAMTMPMLTRNYQFYIRKQQFKKAFAALEIASQKTQIDMGEGVNCYRPDVAGYSNRADCGYFFSEMIKNLQIVQVCEGGALEKGCFAISYNSDSVAAMNGWDVGTFKSSCSGYATEHLDKEAIVYVATAGFIVIPYSYSGGYKNQPNKYTAPIMILDVNGKSGPNKWGHDVMVLHYVKRKAKDSVFSLEANNACALLDKGGIYPTTFVDWLYGRSAELQ